MLLIIKEQLDIHFDINELNKYSEVLLMDDGVYNILTHDFFKLEKKINILGNDLKARGINLPKKFIIINIINYNEFIQLKTDNKIIINQ